jgi:myo-inositol-1(or 4)-monophosphatase
MRSETDAAIRAASLGARLADSRAGADDVRSKGGIDLVTAADVAGEDAIRQELLRAFPDYPIVGEERGGEPRPGQPYWLVDPICGTRPYASNVPLYCTNVALVENGAVTAAAVGIGGTGEVLYAEAGAGAMLRTSAGDRSVRVSDRSDTIWIDGHTPASADVVRRAMLAGHWYVWQFSSSVAFAYLACGRMAGILAFAAKEQPPHGSVHFAAGCFVAAEAGARVNDLDTNRPWTLRTRSFLLAATEELEAGLRKVV